MKMPFALTCWEISIAAAAIWAGASAWGQAPTAPQSPPAATAPASGPAEAAPKLYANVPIDSILNDLARRFDIIIIKPGPLAARVTVRLPEDLDAADALALMQNVVRASGLLINAHGDDTLVWEIVAGTPQQLSVAAAKAQEKAREAAMPLATSRTMKFQFVDVPIETILDEISARLGVEIDRDQPISGRITIIVPQEVDADEAVRLLNAILASYQFTAIPIDRTNADGSARPAVRIGTYEEAKKGEIPVK